MSGSMFPKPLSVERPTGQFVKGVWEAGTPVFPDIHGSVQPVTGKDIDPRDVGRTDKGQVKIFTDAELIVSTRGSNNPGDVLIWQGARWEVVRTLPYDSGLLPHNKYIAEYRKAV